MYYGALKDSNIADMQTDTTAKDWTISYDDSIVKVTDGATGTPNPIKLSTATINYDIFTTVDYRNRFSIVTNVDNPELQGVTLTNNVKNYNKVKLATNVTGLTGYKKVSGVWTANQQLALGDVYVETDGGNLCIGSLQYKLTVGNAAYTPVTTTLNIPVNTSTSIVFGMVDDDGTVMNVLDSSVAVNNYSK